MLRPAEIYYARMIHAIRDAWKTEDDEKRELYLRLAYCCRLLGEVADIAPDDVRFPTDSRH